MFKKRAIEQCLHWLLLTVGLVLFGLLIRRVGLKQLTGLYLRAEKSCWIFGIMIYFISMLCRALKWYLLVKPAYSVTMKQFLPVYLFNAYMGNITPFKSGEALGPVLFKRYFSVEIGQGFSIILIDRIIELIWMLIFLFTGFFYIWTHLSVPPLVSRAILLGGAFTILLVTGLLSVLFIEGFPVITFLLAHFRQRRFHKFLLQIRDELQHFYDFRRQSQIRSRMIVLNGLTACAFLLQFVAVWLVVISLIPVRFLDSLASQAIAIPISILSFIPAGIGIAALGYQSLMSLFGYMAGPVISAALISKILFLGLIFFSGGFSSFILRRGERKRT
jgi:uncharacterized protein (TIRG00374 family)